ncbi:phospho-N-acetylmuramoyl-pentapeptide-transferase [Verrucomicrobium sp. BvORR034]|jgi:phospho-N-acetylmuramoyl-pentapeptide-transferase|uniref:phospho-N-acetylmuramoyl-pentapeptide- transferase n=1 Tax=Verrucomicrobium sp. BvORR034 TaxID=1396418 RepID=UPI0009DD44B7|nr:phospho-N-acetylmuramoyl-pentapeptide-transferase [Verrucomicrobium sp. BvORR034]
MIHWLAEFRNSVGDTLLSSLLNLLHYHTFRAGGACLTAFALSLMFGERVIRKLISLKVGQPIRSKEEVQKLFDLHGKKAGTPTMGGVMMLATFTLSVLLWTDWANPIVWMVLGTTLALGLLGFWDDYEKVARKNSKGVSAKTKLVWQFAVAIAVSWIFAYGLPGGVTYDNQVVTYRSLYIPFFKEPLILDMGFFAVIFFSLMIVGFSNAVNLTDGLDGLATGCSISTGLAYAGFCYLASNVNFAKFLLIPYFHLADELTIVAMALVGACFGFLWFNCQPARMFMGDTGSLALGGAIPTLAIGCKQELILLIVGGVFVMEAGSVMLQVASFKLRKVRIFRMAPIHHHFELGGWQESQVVVRFWMLSLIMALVGLATLKLR